VDALTGFSVGAAPPGEEGVRPVANLLRQPSRVALTGEDLVKRDGELAVTVVDEEAERGALVTEVQDKVAACCAAQEPSGLAVTPTMCMRRVAAAMPNSTYRPLRTIVSTWKKSQARMALA
jgi:hypothetical protein